MAAMFIPLLLMLIPVMVIIFLEGSLTLLPIEYHKIQSGKVWLLMSPAVLGAGGAFMNNVAVLLLAWGMELVVGLIVYPAIVRSYAAYFSEQKMTASMILAYATAWLVSMLPILLVVGTVVYPEAFSVLGFNFLIVVIIKSLLIIALCKLKRDVQIDIRNKKYSAAKLAKKSV